MQFGHLQEAGGMIAKIDWIDLQLSDFEKEDTFSNYKIVFTGFYSLSMTNITHALHYARCTF